MSHRILDATLLVLTFLSATAFAQPFPVTIGRNFTGSTAALLNPPPDTMGAAGIDHFVELNNHLFQGLSQERRGGRAEHQRFPVLDQRRRDADRQQL
jgi:hypothetical protein